MVTFTPWQDYISVVCTLVAVYYSVVGFVFYKKEIIARLRGRYPPQKIPVSTDELKNKHEVLSSSITSDSIDVHELEQEENQAENSFIFNPEMMEQMENLAIRLKELIQEAAEEKQEKTYLLNRIQKTLSEYPTFKGTPFQLSVNALLEVELEEAGLTPLSDDDKLKIWDQVV